MASPAAEALESLYDELTKWLLISNSSDYYNNYVCIPKWND